jgi:hypothetical protein
LALCEFYATSVLINDVPIIVVIFISYIILIELCRLYKYEDMKNMLAISWREQVNVQEDDDQMCFVLDQHAYLDFYSASSLKQQSDDRHITHTGTRPTSVV